MQNGTVTASSRISIPRLRLQSVDLCPNDFRRAKRSTYLRVDVGVIWNNIQKLKEKCADHTEVIAVVKADAYGHGSVGVAKHLNLCGLRHFAVATALEGKQLRENGIFGIILVFGNCVEEEIDTMLDHNLTPTATTSEFIHDWVMKVADRRESIGSVGSDGIRRDSGSSNDRHSNLKPQVAIKVDTGMSRNGCQMEELPELVEACERKKIPIHSIFTHFAQAWDDPAFTQEQLDKFMEATECYRERGIKVHAANSAAVIQGFGTELDYIRPGIAIYGLAPDSTPETAAVMAAMGMQPALSWVARPNLVKTLQPGRKVGYDQTFLVKEEMKIATIALGYADGYNRLLSGKGTVTDEHGHQYKVVGRVSMDAITVQVDDNVTDETPLYIITNDYKSPNSASKMAEMLNTIPYEIGTSLAARLPRLFVVNERFLDTNENGGGSPQTS